MWMDLPSTPKRISAASIDVRLDNLQCLAPLPPSDDDDGVRLLLNETLSPLFPNSSICPGKIHNSWMTDRTKFVDDSPMHTKANQRSVDQCQTQQQTMPGAPPPFPDSDGVRLLSNETLSLHCSKIPQYGQERSTIVG